MSTNMKKRGINTVYPLSEITMDPDYLACLDGQNICMFYSQSFQSTYETIQSDRELTLHDFYTFLYHIGELFYSLHLCKIDFKKKKVLWNRTSPFFEEWILNRSIIEDNLFFLHQMGHPRYISDL
jgi:hypothetical protein